MNDPPAARDLIQAITRSAAALEAELGKAVEGACGLTLAQLAFLRCVADEGGVLALGAVAERLCCAKSNASQLADRLEAQGLVRRDPDPADGRSVRAVVTSRGRSRLVEGERARATVSERLLAGVGEAEREELTLLLERLRDVTGHAGEAWQSRRS